MKTTYSKIHKNMDCPICGETLIESESQDKVACRNPKCNFNTNYIIGFDVAREGSDNSSISYWCKDRDGNWIPYSK